MDDFLKIDKGLQFLMCWGKVAIKLIFFSKLIFKNLLFEKMTADYCLLLVFGNSGENNLLLLEAEMCVCVCVCV